VAREFLDAARTSRTNPATEVAREEDGACEAAYLVDGDGWVDERLEEADEAVAGAFHVGEGGDSGELGGLGEHGGAPSVLGKPGEHSVGGEVVGDGERGGGARANNGGGVNIFVHHNLAEDVDREEELLEIDRGIAEDPAELGSGEDRGEVIGEGGGGSVDSGDAGGDGGDGAGDTYAAISAKSAAKVAAAAVTAAMLAGMSTAMQGMVACGAVYATGQYFPL